MSAAIGALECIILRSQIVDAHHHFWDLAAVEYPWLMARGVRRFFGDPTSIQRNYVAVDLRHDAAPVELLQTVHVQVGCAPGSELAETRWLDQQACHTGLPSAIVAAVDLTRDDVDIQLDAQLAASARVRGARQIVGREPIDDLRTGVGRVLGDPHFVRGLRRLAAHDLTFDLQLSAPQLTDVARLLAVTPDLAVALCHGGSPWDQSIAGLQQWRAGLEQLAKLPRLYCKLSGLSMFMPTWQESQYIAIATVILDIFGPERVMFGSNFPVDGLHRSYGEIFAASQAAVRPYGDAALNAVFGANARAFYRL